MAANEAGLRPQAEAGPGARRYRILLIDYDGRILRTKSIVAEGDDQAREHAGFLVDGRSIEIWEGFRFVARLDPPRAGKD